MSWPDSSRARRALLAFIPALIAGLPLPFRAQGSPTPPASSATQRATITLPTPTAGGSKAPTLSDSARAVLGAEIDRQLKEMADSLKLTPEQRAKARPILLDHAYQVKQMRDKYATQEKTPAVMDAMRREMQGKRDSTDVKLGHVFTVDQMAHYKKMRDEGLTRMRSKMGITGTPSVSAPGTPAPTAPAPADTARKK